LTPLQAIDINLKWCLSCPGLKDNLQHYPEGGGSWTSRTLKRSWLGLLLPLSWLVLPSPFRVVGQRAIKNLLHLALKRKRRLPVRALEPKAIGAVSTKNENP
jgi:hypothetical protein